MKRGILLIIVLLLPLISAHDGDGPHAEDNEFCVPGEDTCTTLSSTYQPPLWMYIVGSLSLILAIGLTVLWIRRPKKRRTVSSVLQYWLIPVITIALLYSVAQFYASEADKGIIVCNSNGDCTISIHTHWYLDAKICGESLDLPDETGALSEMHTHKEFNRAHFHETIDYDKTTGKVMEHEKQRLTVRAFFDQLEIPFSDTCFADKCNGDVCPGSVEAGTLTFYRNIDGEWVAQDTLQEYVYEDEEKIRVVFS